jgi:NTE family protein
MMYYNRAVALPDILGSGVFVGGSLEAGQMQGRIGEQGSTGTIWSGSVFLAANTFAGPAYFGFGLGENGHYSVYLLLGVP